MAKYSAKMLKLASDLILKYEQAILDLEENRVHVKEIRKQWRDFGDGYKCPFCIESGYAEAPVFSKEEEKACRKCILSGSPPVESGCSGYDGTAISLGKEPASSTYRGIEKSMCIGDYTCWGRTGMDGVLNRPEHRESIVEALKNRLAWILRTIDEAGYEVSAL
jgi:hypothetical protein